MLVGSQFGIATALVQGLCDAGQGGGGAGEWAQGREAEEGGVN